MFVSPTPSSTYFRFRTGIFDLKRSSRGQTPPAIFHFIYLLKNIFLKDEKDVGRWHCGSVFNWSSASSAQDAVVIATVGDRVDSENVIEDRHVWRWKTGKKKFHLQAAILQFQFRKCITVRKKGPRFLSEWVFKIEHTLSEWRMTFQRKYLFIYIFWNFLFFLFLQHNLVWNVCGKVRLLWTYMKKS